MAAKKSNQIVINIPDKKAEKHGKEGCSTTCHTPVMCGGGCGGAAYGLGVIGAAVYFIAKATGFWAGVLGFLKALVWPGYVVYGLLKFLGV